MPVRILANYLICIQSLLQKKISLEEEELYQFKNSEGSNLGDGADILYVNGEYKGPDDIGYLMHDFNCTDPNDMHFLEMAERTRYLKENPKGGE